MIPNPTCEVIPEKLEIQFAYIVPKGNPFKKYSKLDFDLSEDVIKIESSGVEILDREGNKVKFGINETDFEIELTGFDQERDLIVKI